ncbi:MAG: hypothetical protein KF842_10050 [Caulobacter sp.]|nr:hypothetical protein [Caulobacter sp.]
MRLAVRVATALAAATIGGAAHSQDAERMLAGDYVATGADGVSCHFTLSYADDVGGEVEAGAGCEGALGPINDAARWSSDGAGGFRLFNALRKPVAQAIEDEAGLTLRVGERDFALAGPPSPQLTETERAAGSWLLYDKSAPTRPLCRLSLTVNGGVAVSQCSRRWRNLQGAKWQVIPGGVALTPRRSPTVRLLWRDAATLAPDAASWAMVKAAQ